MKKYIEFLENLTVNQNDFDTSFSELYNELKNFWSNSKIKNPVNLKEKKEKFDYAYNGLLGLGFRKPEDEVRIKNLLKRFIKDNPELTKESIPIKMKFYLKSKGILPLENFKPVAAKK